MADLDTRRTTAPPVTARPAVPAPGAPDSAALTLLHDVPLFAGLPVHVVRELAQCLRVRSHPARACVVREGSAGAGLHIVAVGQVALQRGPHAHLVTVRGRGEIFGEVAVFDPRPWPFTAIAMTPVLLGEVAREDALAWVCRHPMASARMLQHLARLLSKDDRVPDSPLRLDVPARVARMLLVLADRYARGDVVQHGLSQQQLGDIVGASREAVNKTLVGFSDAAWIRHYRHGFVLLDRAGLQSRADLGATAPSAR